MAACGLPAGEKRHSSKGADLQKGVTCSWEVTHSPPPRTRSFNSRWAEPGKVAHLWPRPGVCIPGRRLGSFAV